MQHQPQGNSLPFHISFIRGVAYGFRDSIFGVKALFVKRNKRTTSNRQAKGARSSVSTGSGANEDVTLNRIYKCCLLNGGVFGASILMFEYALIPLLQWLIGLSLSFDDDLTSSVWFWLRPILSYTFGALWILPLFCLSRVINIFWFQDVANSTIKGRIISMNFPTLVADTLYSFVIQLLFLLQANLVALLPVQYIGSITSLVFMSILYALYSFEYKWFNNGWDTPRRLYTIEHNWTYFLGFGLPLALLTFISSSYFVNGIIFSVLFPFFIVSANEAELTRGLCEHPLPFFKFTIWLTNSITKLLFRR